VRALFDFHRTWAYVAIVVNGLVGVAALAAWRFERLRGRWVLIATTVAGVAMLIQVAIGATLQASKQYKAPDFHIFYGILVFLTVTLAYSYRRQLRRRRELYCALLCLFVMGLGIRAVLQVHG
jgi:hypothetical protein